MAAFVGSAGSWGVTAAVAGRDRFPRLNRIAPRPVVVSAAATRREGARMAAAGGPQRCLVIGGTRFSGLYLIQELLARGHEVVMYNRGNTSIGDPKLMIPGESQADFDARNARTSVIVGDRTNGEELRDKLAGLKFDAVFDNNGRSLEDSAPLVDAAADMGVKHYVYMSSAGVYLKSDVMPHVEGDATDPKSRHLGKAQTEAYMVDAGIPYTSIRPTYIYGALNYNPLEQWFFERLAAGRPVCVPGHGAHLTGLGHVRDLATAMAATIETDASVGQVYNIQDRHAVTFDGVARTAATAMGMDPASVDLVHYNPKDFDFGKNKAFPFRPQHFFTSPNKALRELDWSVQYELASGWKDTYENDFVPKQAQGKLKNDWVTDDMILGR